MRRLLALITVAVLAFPLVAQADTLTVTFTAERREVHGPVPAVIEVARLDTSSVTGQTCAVTFHAFNNTSEHNTDLIVDTGGQLATVFDIERGPGSETDFDLGLLTVGDVLIVKLRLNEHNARGFAVSSLGGTVTLDCQEQPSTTTTTPPTTAPTTSSSTTPATTATTTTPAPSTTAPEPTVTSQPSTSITPPVVVDTWPELVTTSTGQPGSSVPDTPPSTTPDRLPDTGLGAGTLALAAFGLLTTGGYAAWRFRKQ